MILVVVVVVVVVDDVVVVVNRETTEVGFVTCLRIAQSMNRKKTWTISFCLGTALKQWFPTCGTRTPRWYARNLKLCFKSLSIFMKM